jgi:hypothetical protein
MQKHLDLDKKEQGDEQQQKRTLQQDLEDEKILKSANKEVEEQLTLLEANQSFYGAIYSYIQVGRSNQDISNVITSDSIEH